MGNHTTQWLKVPEEGFYIEPISLDKLAHLAEVNPRCVFLFRGVYLRTPLRHMASVVYFASCVYPNPTSVPYSDPRFIFFCSQTATVHGGRSG